MCKLAMNRGIPLKCIVIITNQCPKAKFPEEKKVIWLIQYELFNMNLTPFRYNGQLSPLNGTSSNLL